MPWVPSARLSRAFSVVSEPTPTRSLASGVAAGSAEAGATEIIVAADAATAVVARPARKLRARMSFSFSVGGDLRGLVGRGSHQVGQQPHHHIRREPGEGDRRSGGDHPDSDGRPALTR